MSDESDNDDVRRIKATRVGIGSTPKASVNAGAARAARDARTVLGIPVVDPNAVAPMQQSERPYPAHPAAPPSPPAPPPAPPRRAAPVQSGHTVHMGSATRVAPPVQAQAPAPPNSAARARSNQSQAYNTLYVEPPSDELGTANTDELPGPGPMHMGGAPDATYGMPPMPAEPQAYPNYQDYQDYAPPPPPPGHSPRQPAWNEDMRRVIRQAPTMRVSPREARRGLRLNLDDGEAAYFEEDDLRGARVPKSPLPRLLKWMLILGLFGGGAYYVQTHGGIDELEPQLSAAYKLAMTYWGELTGDGPPPPDVPEEEVGTDLDDPALSLPGVMLPSSPRPSNPAAGPATGIDTDPNATPGTSGTSSLPMNPRPAQPGADANAPGATAPHNPAFDSTRAQLEYVPPPITEIPRPSALPTSPLTATRAQLEAAEKTAKGQAPSAAPSAAENAPKRELRTSNSELAGASATEHAPAARTAPAPKPQAQPTQAAPAVRSAAAKDSATASAPDATQPKQARLPSTPRANTAPSNNNVLRVRPIDETPPEPPSTSSSFPVDPPEPF